MTFIDPIAFHIGDLAVRWYGLMYFLGILLVWQYIRWAVKGFPFLARADVDDVIPWLVSGIVLGGRLGYVLFYEPSMFWYAPLSVLNTRCGGMSFHGGLLGVLCALFFYARRKGLPLAPLVDLMAIGAPIGIFFGRLGNFINQEAYGRITDVPWAIVFPRVDHFLRHPSQLYEAGLEGVLLFLLLFWVKRFFAHVPWMLSAIFLLVYGAFRWLAEIYRVPDGVWVLGYDIVLTYGQLLSLPMILVGGTYIWRKLRRTP